jgi:HAD superfamily hydrolase (TIGR01509 family)
LILESTRSGVSLGGIVSSTAPAHSAQPRVKAYLFDIDDTIVDFRHARQAGLAAVQSDFPSLQPTPLVELDLDYLAIVNTVHTRVLRGELTYADAGRERMRRLFAQYALPATPTAIEHAADTYQQSFLVARRAVPGVIPLLAALKAEAGIAVVTNNMVAEQQVKLRACGLEPFIDVMVAPDSIGVAKPHPRIFAATLDQLGCAAAEAVMVGDSWQEDILGAQSAGIRAIWLNRYGLAHPDPALAVEIYSFEPLDTILALLRNPPRARYDARAASQA